MITHDEGSCHSDYDVLVVDDDEDTLYLLMAHLASKGIHAKGMTSGKDLPGMIARDHPRLVLLDVMMPAFNGFAVFEAAKTEMALHGTAIYFVSALPEADLSWHAERSGASGYITKPFSMAEIDAALAATGFSSGLA